LDVRWTILELKGNGTNCTRPSDIEGLTCSNTSELRIGEFDCAGDCHENRGEEEGCELHGSRRIKRSRRRSVRGDRDYGEEVQVKVVLGEEK